MRYSALNQEHIGAGDPGIPCADRDALMPTVSHNLVILASGILVATIAWRYRPHVVEYVEARVAWVSWRSFDRKLPVGHAIFALLRTGHQIDVHEVVKIGIASQDGFRNREQQQKDSENECCREGRGHDRGSERTSGGRRKLYEKLSPSPPFMSRSWTSNRKCDADA